MGATTNLSQSNVQLSFLMIKQEWLRTRSNLYLKLLSAALLSEHMPYSRAVDCMLLELPCRRRNRG